MEGFKLETNKDDSVSNYRELFNLTEERVAEIDEGIKAVIDNLNKANPNGIGNTRELVGGMAVIPKTPEETAFLFLKVGMALSSVINNPLNKLLTSLLGK